MTRGTQNLALALLVFMGGIGARASSEDSPRAVDAAKAQGVASCAQSFCHGSARALTATHVLQNEYTTWSNFDPHSRAFALLRNKQSQRIAARLGLANAVEAPQCLACHADNIAKHLRGPKFQLADGIGCETCHGAAQRWLASHDDWPDVQHVDNVKLGLRPLDSPKARAQLCVQCHVGARDRQATHAMMAAGHPRLSFELDTFTELWRTSGGREHYRRDADYAMRKSAATGRGIWVAGLIETSRQRMAMVEAGAKKATLLPEFANFNCYSCHRAMRPNDWPLTAASAAPGQLRFDDSSLRVLAAAFDGAAHPLGGRLRTATDRWQRAAAQPTELTVAHQELRDLLREAEANANAVSAGGGARAGRIVQSLVQSADRGDYPDYAAAEQAAMAIALLLAEQGQPLRARPELDTLFRALENDAQYDARLFRERTQTFAPQKIGPQRIGP